MEDFKVYTRDPSTGAVTLVPPSIPTRISGRDKLVQTVILALLNNPGRNVLYPERGSGLPGLIGQSNLNPSDPTEIIASVSERIERVKDEIIDSQSTLENETPSERLQELLLVNVESGTQIDEVVVILRVVSEAGDEIDLTI